MSTRTTRAFAPEHKEVRIYYSTADTHPPYRADVAELFGHCLPGLGVEVEWYMTRNKPGACGTESFARQKVYLPWRAEGSNLVAKIANKFSYWLCDACVMLGLMFDKSHNLIQVRDKYIAALIGLLVARVKGIKFVYWCSYPFPEHDLELARQKSGMSQRYLQLRGRIGEWLLYRFVMKFCDHVFVQSEQMKHDLLQYGVAVDKMTPVPMGVSARMQNWIDAHALEVVPNRVVYLGTMSAVRQLHVLIDAFSEVHRRCPEAQFLMVGDGDYPHERAALEQQVEKLGLRDAVHFTGFVPIEEAWGHAASAAVCVSPFYPTKILASTSPTKLVEYMAIGRPVVCNDHPEQSAITSDSGAGMCVGWGSDTFADAIVWMLEHPQEAEVMGAKGPAWVAANRTYSIIAAQVWRRYQSIFGLPQ